MHGDINEKRITQRKTEFMMNFQDNLEAFKQIDDLELVTSFSFGGFQWLGFSKEQPNKMLCISSQKATILNCENGILEECNVEYDEMELIAICDKLLNEEISIAGQYGGELPLTTSRGEQVIIQETEEHIMTIFFVSARDAKRKVYWNYSAYICGFSYNGNYFVLADDGGILVMKRKK